MNFSEANAIEVNKIRKFIDIHRGAIVQSTGFLVVHYSGDLYNVSGSTPDPKAVPGYKGATWTKLLKGNSHFAGKSCYVTDPGPKKPSTHPGFDVGGHMTPTSNGAVEDGECYLMPLCKWHNSPYRNGITFKHTETKMLKLIGYMQGDVALTFKMRMAKTHTLLYLDPYSKSWVFKELSDDEKQGIVRMSLTSKSNTLNSEEFAIFEKQGDNFFIESSYIREVG